MLPGDRPAEAERDAVDLLRRGMSAALGVVVARSDEGRVQVAVARHDRTSPHRTSCAAATRSIAASSSGTRGAGHADVLHPRHARLLEGAEAIRRAWRSQSASVGSVARTTRSRPPLDAGLGGFAARRRRRIRRVRLDEQHRRGVSVQPEVVRSRPRRRSSRVHQLERHRHDARGGHRGHGLAGRDDVGKKASIVACGPGAGRRRRVASVTIPSVPSRADEEVGQRRSPRRP